MTSTRSIAWNRPVCVIASLVLLVTVTPVGGSATLPSWGYTTNGPSTWSATYPACGGSDQSPVNLVHSTVDSALSALSLGAAAQTDSVTVRNTGRTVSASVSTPSLFTLTVPTTISSLSYRLETIHFHWVPAAGLTGDATWSTGSEHQIEGKQYALEAHFIFFASTYANVSAAAGNANGVVILASLFKVGDMHPSLGNLTSQLNRVHFFNGALSLNLSPNDVWSWVVDTKNYYTYHGSWTTPPCTTEVTWLVSGTVGSLSATQLAHFQGLVSDSDVSVSPANSISPNNRPIQPIGSRHIRASFTPAVDAHGDGHHDDEPLAIGLGVAFSCVVFAIAWEIARRSDVKYKDEDTHHFHREESAPVVDPVELAQQTETETAAIEEFLHDNASVDVPPAAGFDDDSNHASDVELTDATRARGGSSVRNVYSDHGQSGSEEE